LSQDSPQSVDNPDRKAFSRLRDKLLKTRSQLVSGLGGLLGTQRGIDPPLLEELEELLIVSDVGLETSQYLVDRIGTTPGREQQKGVVALLKQGLLDILAPCEQILQPQHDDRPFVILVVGVNGVGKTTTLGKLAWQFKRDGLSVMLAAADTFRAAAIEQLGVWAKRADCPVIQQQHGADAASVAHDAVQSAIARKIDVLLIDTAGRQATHSNLMEELKKIRRVLTKLDETAPHETLMVLDASTGQNALSQLTQFHSAIGVTGVCLTKLDGTAKGGILIAIAKRLGLPIRYIGIGEGTEDLHPFNAEEFVDALLPAMDQAK